MAKLEKKLKKKTKKLNKRVFGKKSLTLMQNYVITTSFYGRNKDKKPYVTITATGDYKISVAKLILILLGIFSAAVLIVVCIKALADWCFAKKRHKAEDADDDLEDYYTEDGEISF